ncbi:MAG: ArgR family transcriptional regulator [Spirochaetales bacterium]|nr:ArgR family transcriptional regulator [Spirochaetales bacterium]
MSNLIYYKLRTTFKEVILTGQESRRRLILSILRDEKVHSQEELQQRLKIAGIDVTQATLSRDLKMMGIARIPDTEEGYIYAVKREMEKMPEPFIKDDIKRGILNVQFSGNLAVIKTKLGHATGVAFAIDELAIPEIIGTLGGEDTLLVILKENTDRQKFLNTLLG